jgi:hypothetical protein
MVPDLGAIIDVPVLKADMHKAMQDSPSQEFKKAMEADMSAMQDTAAKIYGLLLYARIRLPMDKAVESECEKLSDVCFDAIRL